MESEAIKFPVNQRQVVILREVPSLHEDILRHIATFLDFQSIRQFRLVSREWNSAGTAILMKRGYYDLTYPCHEHELLDLYRGAIHYSSWKISHSVYESAQLLHDNEIWRSIRSLGIHQPFPLTREFHSWAWETIENRCPKLQEVTFVFRPNSSVQPESEVASDYQQAIQGPPNPSFPKIPSLRNLVSVHFKGICEKTTAYFAQHLLAATTPSLRHLYFCPISEPTDLKLESGEVYRIFEYLKQNLALLRNLHSFGFYLGRYFINGKNDGLVCFRDYKDQCEFTKYLKLDICFPLQFSENLTKLFWDCPFHLHEQFLPGVLTPSVASSLVQLCLSGEVESLRETDDPYPRKISFPNFPRLRGLSMGFYTCQFLSAPELIDSAPNLYVLEIKGKPGSLSHGCFRWQGSDRESYSNPKHLQLRIFRTDFPLSSVSTLEMISSKFPHLVELRIGRILYSGLDPILSFVKSNHSKLERLSWTYNVQFNLDELFHHLIRLPELLHTLTTYSLGHANKDPRHPHSSINIQEMKQSANILLNLPPNSDNPSCRLAINLLIPYLTCPHHCNPENESIRDDNCGQCYLHKFIQVNSLPIRIHCEREIQEIRLQYEKNHSLENIWIYE
jgi:hypothetical protein